MPKARPCFCREQPAQAHACHPTDHGALLLLRMVSDLHVVLSSRMLHSLQAELQAVQLPGSVDAADVFDGCIGVLTEVPAKKISSEEETWSGQSLMIFYNNWLGAYSQIAPFADLVRAPQLRLGSAMQQQQMIQLRTLHDMP